MGGGNTSRCGFLWEKNPSSHGLEYNSLSMMLFRVGLKQHSVQGGYWKEWSWSPTVRSPIMAVTVDRNLFFDCLKPAEQKVSCRKEDRGRGWEPDSCAGLFFSLVPFSLLLRLFLVEYTGWWKKGRKVNELQTGMLQVTFPVQPSYPLPDYLSVCFSPEPTKSNSDENKKQNIWETIVITSQDK